MPKTVQTITQLYSSHTLALASHQQSNAQNSLSQASAVGELRTSDVQAGFRKDGGTRDQITIIHWIIEKAREFQENIYFCCIDYAKAFDYVDHNKLENSSRDGSFPDLEPVYCSMSGSICCFLTCIQISQEASKLIWYSHLLKNFSQLVVFYTIRGFSVINKAEVDFFFFSVLLLF